MAVVYTRMWVIILSVISILLCYAATAVAPAYAEEAADPSGSVAIYFLCNGQAELADGSWVEYGLFQVNSNLTGFSPSTSYYFNLPLTSTTDITPSSTGVLNVSGTYAMYYYSNLNVTPYKVGDSMAWSVFPSGIDTTAVLSGTTTVLQGSGGDCGQAPDPTPTTTPTSTSSPSGTYTPPPGCPPLEFFGVRGSGEHSGFGSTIGPEEQALKNSVHAMTADAINYPAIDVPIPDIIGYADSVLNLSPVGVAIFQHELDVYHSAYDNSVTAGVGSLLGDYNAYQRRCPGGPAVFAGYSQGADVVAQAYSALPAAKQRNVFVTLFGDPHFNPGQPSIDEGGFNPSYKAILVSIWGDAPHSFSVADNSNVRSWCLKGDAVCNFTLQGILGALSASFPHYHYMDSDTTLAAQWVYQSWMQMP